MFHQKMRRISIVCLAAILLCGCTGENSTESTKGSEQADFSMSETFQTENPKAVNLAGLLQEKAFGMMVQIRTDQVMGSGCIFSMTEETTTVVTVGHVLENAGEVSLTFADGEMLSDQIPGVKDFKVSLSKTSDLGWITFPTRDIPEKTLAICCYAATDKKVLDRLQPQDILLFMGSLEGVAENAYEGILTDSWIYMEDYGQHMMLASAHSQTGIIQPGMSGAGVFNSQGYFVGLLSGADTQGNLAVLPLNVIWAELGDIS